MRSAVPQMLVLVCALPGASNAADLGDRIDRLEREVQGQEAELRRQATELRVLQALAPADARAATAHQGAQPTNPPPSGAMKPGAELVCNRHDRGLRVQSNVNAGWGNRIGWWLTAAAMGNCLNKTVLTFWRHTTAAGHCCDYDVPTVLGVVRFPAALRVVDAGTYAAAKGSTDEIPWHPRPYVNDYVPEPGWHMWSDWTKRGIFPRCDVTRDRFLSAHRSAAAQLKSRVDLCLPSPRTYLVLHLRRGDKGDVSVPLNKTGTWAAVTAISRAVSPRLSWLTVSNSPADKASADLLLRARGETVVQLGCGADALLRRLPPPPPPRSARGLSNRPPRGQAKPSGAPGANGTAAARRSHGVNETAAARLARSTIGALQAKPPCGSRATAA